MPFGTSSEVSCAAEPCQTPSVRVARPPTLAASGTVVSITMLPGRIAGLSCLSRAAWPSKGMVSASRSAAPQAAVFSSPETFAPGVLCLILSAASRARWASREPMITVSPACAQRNARPNPSGPVPPRTAMGRGALMGWLSCDLLCKLGFEQLLGSDCFDRQLEIDSRVDGIAFGGDTTSFQNQGLKIFRAGVLSGRRSSFARDIFFHEGSAVVVGAGVQAQLRQMAVQFHPRHLNVINGTGQENSREGVDLEMFGKRGTGSCNSLMEEQSILVDESE